MSSEGSEGYSFVITCLFALNRVCGLCMIFGNITHQNLPQQSDVFICQKRI